MNASQPETANQLLALVERGGVLSAGQAIQLAGESDTAKLMASAARLRDQHHRNLITYSRKVFIPLTHLCRNVCHYCTFAQTPGQLISPYMPVEEVLQQVRLGAEQGCKEALLTLGEKPELRYVAARQVLKEMGFVSTLEYVAHVAKRIFEETGVFPHINAGCMTAEEIALLRPVSASMGIMLESASTRLCEKGGPHFGSADKQPEQRLKTIRLVGEANVPFTSGILIGIGETRRERIESLLALRDVHQQYGHLQEIIIQNFRAKAETKMAQSPEPDLDDMLWTLAIARLVFGADMSIQAPPNLSPGVLPQIINAGINDWGGVSPVTPDFVNPEAPWPHLDKLAKETALTGKYLQERLTVYPDYVLDYTRWLAPELHRAVLQAVDTEGFPRTDDWLTGRDQTPPEADTSCLQQSLNPKSVSSEVQHIVNQSIEGELLSEQQIVRLFQSRGADFAYVCQQADQRRQTLCADTVSFVVNRNINYTNICYFKCQFCAFSKGKSSEDLRGRPYDLGNEEIAQRTEEAWQMGATEVCLQGGIHPDYTGQTYIDICRAVKSVAPDMHIHGFSPLEIWQGAQTLNLSVEQFLMCLKEAGLGTLPGTAAEILDDDVRQIICHDKINTAQWLEVMETAHRLGLKSTSTIMFGHVDRLAHWASHLVSIRDLQLRTGGFTEFVPLAFVADESPVYLKGRARRGPTFRECVLMHAVARLVLSPVIRNIQTSWVKLGQAGTQICLQAGANDLGGTLMNESITRAAGACHGEEMSAMQLESQIEILGRDPWQRTTLYEPVSEERLAAARKSMRLKSKVLGKSA